jgi:hypothetical protein
LKNNFLGISLSDFQPYSIAFYKLHLKILLECGFLNIYIVHPDCDETKYSPFTSREVSKMIRNSFSSEQLKFIKIIFVKDENDIKLNSKNKKIRYYYFDNSPYKLNNIICDRIKVSWDKNFKTGKEILDSVYGKNQDVFDQVHELNTKYLRRLIIPF